MNQTVKNKPSVNDCLFIAGIGLLATGISFNWGWPIACVTIGLIFAAVSIASKLRGNE